MSHPTSQVNSRGYRRSLPLELEQRRLESRRSISRMRERCAALRKALCKEGGI
jgi:hypothetical protein